MKSTTIKKIGATLILLGVLFNSSSVVFAQYDMGTTYPTYDMGTTYPTYDMGTTYPTYSTGVTYPVYTTGTTYTTPVYTTPVYTTPVYTTPVYTTPTPGPCPAGGYVRLANGSCGCPAGTVPAMPDGCRPPTTGGQCPMDARVCPDGSSVGRTGPNCTFAACPAPTPVIPVTPVTRCADGQLPHPITGCTRTTTIQVTNNTICSDGQYPHPTTGCNRVNVIPTVQYQTCWNGTTIPTTAVCPAQFKVCANGTSIPVNQTCYVAPTPTYVPPVVVKFNNVVTSVVTEITQTSGRCNGIGLIANNAQSRGWFEYGETTNLGRSTAEAQIGSSNTAPFSNVLANLKPSTKYYCRAVMQNQYGIVKGEIVGFTTKGKVTTYVKPVTVTTKVSTSKVTSTKKNEILCTDGTTVKVGNQSSATLINEGQKLVTLSIEKTEGKVASEGIVKYKINFKNLSDTRLTGVMIRVMLPQELKLMSANIGNYDEATRVLTLNQDGIDPYTEGSILLTATVMKDAPLGKTLVTNVYALYTVPGTQIQDEVTAYVIGSVVPQAEIAKEDTGAKKVVGVSSDVKGFMPNSLIEWLALLAILFIIFILGRSIYASYKDGEHTRH